MQNDQGPTPLTPTTSLATSQQNREVKTREFLNFHDTVHSTILTITEAIRILQHTQPRFFSVYSSSGPIVTKESDSDSQ